MKCEVCNDDTYMTMTRPLDHPNYFLHECTECGWHKLVPRSAAAHEGNYIKYIYTFTIHGSNIDVEIGVSVSKDIVTPEEQELRDIMLTAGETFCTYHARTKKAAEAD